MDEPSQPEPQPTPAPAAPRVEVVECPSCGSRYNAATRELVLDSKLREQVRDLENQIIARQTEYASLEQTAQASALQVIELTQRLEELHGNAAGQTESDFVIG